MRKIIPTFTALTCLAIASSVMADTARIVVSPKPHFSNYAAGGDTKCLVVGVNGEACFKVPNFRTAQENSVNGLSNKPVFNFHLLNVEYDNASTDEVIKALKSSGMFDTVELDIELKSQSSFNDPYYQHQTYLENATPDNPHAMNFAQANDLVPDDSPNIGVMVIDGGFHLHDDLVYENGYNFLTIPNTDVSASPQFYSLGDDNNHGLGVASVINATRNNNLAMTGAAKNVSLYAANNAYNGSGSVFGQAEAIMWAAGADLPDHPELPTIITPIRVINISQGGFGDGGCLSFIKAAVALALDANISLVAGAGNDSKDAINFYPAACENFISVGATGHEESDGNIASYSNFGDTVDIMARGSNIIGLQEDSADSAQGSFGTSFSTPLVTSAMALATHVAPDMSNDTKLKLLKFTARSINTTECESKGCGAGLLDAGAFVSAAKSVSNNTLSTITHALADKKECELDWYLDNFGSQARLCELYKVTFFGGLSKEDNTFRLTRITKGTDFNAHFSDDNAEQPEHILDTQNPTALLRDFDNTNYDYGFQFCSENNGNLECETSITKLETSAINAPAKCS